MDGLIYYVLDATRHEQRMKIGFTTQLRKRLDSLRRQTVSRQEPLLIAAEGGTLEIERQRHRQFYELRLMGEWFRYEGALREWVADLPNPHSHLLENANLWKYAQTVGLVPDVPVSRIIPPIEPDFEPELEAPDAPPPLDVVEF